MRKICTILLTLSLFGASRAQSQQLVWAAQIDDNDTSHLYVHDNLADRYGNVYIAGQFGGILDFDPGPGVYPLVSLNNHAAFVAKYDASGKLKWARAMISDTVLTIGSDINAIALDDAGCVYALGSFYATTDFDPGSGIHQLVAAFGHDMFIEKLDSSGNFGWATQFPGTYNIAAKDIAITSTNEVYVTGTFGGGTFDFDPSPAVYNLACSGGLDVFTLKLSNNGNLLWANQISGASSEYPTSISAGENGNVYLTGYYLGTADFDPGPANYNMSSNGYYDMFVAKFDMSGNLVWANSFGSTGNEISASIVCDHAGNTYTTGKFNYSVDFDPGAAVQILASAGYYDAFILKLDAGGAYKWAKRIGGSRGDIGTAVSISDSSINLTTVFSDSIDLDPGAGSLYMGVPGNQQFGFVSLDTGGNLKWAMTEGHPIAAEGNCYMAEDYMGYTYVTGRFIGTIDCDPGPAVYNISSAAHNLFSYFILKIKPAVNPSTVQGVENGNSNYSIYPNPANGTINISAAQIIDRIVVRDITGKVIYDLQPANNVVSLNISSPGMYSVSLTSNQAVVVEKIIVTGP